MTVGDAEAAGLCVVVLHGHAMAPEDLAPFARSMGVPGLYCFPAGLRAAEPRGRSWWPVDEEARQQAQCGGPRDLAHISPAAREPARAAVASLLRQPPLAGARTRVLAGFSQGGMLACDTLLHEEVTVDGLALFSSSRIALPQWTPRRDRLRGLPALVTHGRGDEDLAFEAGCGLYQWLAESGALARWLPFEGGHEMPLAVWREFRRFLREISAGARSPSHGQGPCE